MYTENQIITDLRNLLNPNAFFYTKENGDLTMSLDGEFVDHTWKAGTFIPDGSAPAAKHSANVGTVTKEDENANTQFYTKMYIETLERLSTRVAEGDSTPRNTSEQILELTNALRQLHSL